MCPYPQQLVVLWLYFGNRIFFLLFVVCCMLYVVCCMLYVVCCMLYVVCCMLYVVCCMLYVVCCMLYVVCCLLFCFVLFYFISFHFISFHFILFVFVFVFVFVFMFLITTKVIQHSNLNHETIWRASDITLIPLGSGREFNRLNVVSDPELTRTAPLVLASNGKLPWVVSHCTIPIANHAFSYAGESHTSISVTLSTYHLLLQPPTISKLIGDEFEFAGLLTIIGTNFGTLIQDVKVVLNGIITGSIEAQVLNVSNSLLVCSVPVGSGKQMNVYDGAVPQNTLNSCL